MKNTLTMKELERRRAAIDAKTHAQPTEDELQAFAEADAEDPAEAVTLEEYRTQLEYSGRLMLRVPKELHKELAEAAKENGVSLNQYAVYKLAK